MTRTSEWPAIAQCALQRPAPCLESDWQKRALSPVRFLILSDHAPKHFRLDCSSDTPGRSDPLNSGATGVCFCGYAFETNLTPTHPLPSLLPITHTHASPRRRVATRHPRCCCARYSVPCLADTGTACETIRMQPLSANPSLTLLRMMLIVQRRSTIEKLRSTNRVITSTLVKVRSGSFGNCDASTRQTLRKAPESPCSRVVPCASPNLLSQPT